MEKYSYLQYFPENFLEELPLPAGNSCPGVPARLRADRTSDASPSRPCPQAGHEMTSQDRRLCRHAAGPRLGSGPPGAVQRAETQRRPTGSGMRLVALACWRRPAHLSPVRHMHPALDDLLAIELRR